MNANKMDYIITLKPEWLALLLSGDKTLELQKTNLKIGKVGLAASGTLKLFGTAQVVEVVKMNMADLKTVKNKIGHQVDLNSDFFKKYMGERNFLWAHKLEDVRVFVTPVNYTRKRGQVVKVSEINKVTQDEVKKTKLYKKNKILSSKYFKNLINKYVKDKSKIFKNNLTTEETQEKLFDEIRTADKRCEKKDGCRITKTCKKQTNGKCISTSKRVIKMRAHISDQIKNKKKKCSKSMCVDGLHLLSRYLNLSR
jgi:hypothetical protein